MNAEHDKLVAMELVRDFISDMNKWEQLCNEIENDSTLTYDQQSAKQKEILTALFLQYCTNKERKNGRPTVVSYGVGNSFEYDAVEETIVDVSVEGDGKMLVYTGRKKPMPENMVYVLVKVGGKWLIDSKKRESAREKKWKPVSL